MKQLHGTGVALITPFREDFSVDEDALRRIVRTCIDGGVDYLVALGTTAESVTLSKSEKQQVMEVVVDENAGALPLVVGIGGNNTLQLAEELQNTDLGSFVAVLSVSPYYNRPTQEGIYQHFKYLSKASPKPLIVYNVPVRTGSNMMPTTVMRLAGQCPNIIAIKEASGDMAQIRTLIKTAPPGFLVISGDDSIALETIEAGGVGVISVLGQGVPAEYSKMIRLAMGGDFTAARDLHMRIQQGIELIFREGNPAGIKAVFEFLGLASARVRLPLVEASDDLKKEIATYVRSFSNIPA